MGVKSSGVRMPMVCLREPVPSSVLTQPHLNNPRAFGYFLLRGSFQCCWCRIKGYRRGVRGSFLPGDFFFFRRHGVWNFWGIPFFPLFTGNLLPAFPTLWLVRTLTLFRRFLQFCYYCSGWLLFLRAELGNVAKLFAAPKAKPSALHHYNHLPIPAGDDFWDGLEAFPC